MHKETRLIVQKKEQKAYKSGYPLLAKEAFINAKDLQREGDLVKLVDDNGQFIARGYYGIQNKGIGWILTDKENERIDQGFFKKMIKKAIEDRADLFADEKTTAFRVFNGEGDGIGGLSIDYFAGFYLITWYSKGIFAFKDSIISALEDTVSYEGIYEKKRFAKTGQYVEDDDFVKGKRGEFPLIVKENGVNFAVYLNDGAMTGIFLDQRNVRKAVLERYAAGKRVLNTFSYTGAFSVCAALGGAQKTTSVDLANRSKSKTIEQFSVNGIDYEAQDIIVEDVFQYFKYANRKSLKFDLIILDPPSFARSKKMTFSAAKDYTNLLKETITITETNGRIIASTNCNTFGMKKFKGFIETAFKELGRRYKIAEEFTLPDDFKTARAFPEGQYLKVVVIEVF